MTLQTREPTVGELVVEKPARARVFENLGIDYCCGGKKPLSQACEEKGLDAKTVLRLLDVIDRQQASGSDRNWAGATMTELADHIEQKHHAYLRQELPRLDALTTKVANAHGPRRPELLEVRQLFLHFRAELESHMAKEEQILFPICRAMDRGQPEAGRHCGSVQNPIRVMVQEHDDAGHALERFRTLTHNYTPPEDACNTYRAMLDSLAQLEHDMHEHVFKENSILFPKAIAAEEGH
jgi:regulator of cell morphogenesis and NO signaling